MFRKFLIFAMFAAAAGYCFAATSGLPEVVTSEVFYTQERDVQESRYEDVVRTPQYVVEEYQQVEQVQPVVQMPAVVPTWPLVGSDADVEVSCESGVCSKKKQDDNIRIVSKIGADLVVENNFNMGARGEYAGWSGGANMLHGSQLPAGFDDECDSGAEMPLLHREMLEDDGAAVLAVSRSGRKNCAKYADGYTQYLAKNGASADAIAAAGGIITDEMTVAASDSGEIAVDLSADAEAPKQLSDQVRSWVVASGQTLREVLQSWCDKEGWDLVWTTSREYPIEASAVFKGRFVDVASALVRNFGRATPIPYAKFYKGNRVLVVSTAEE